MQDESKTPAKSLVYYNNIVLIRIKQKKPNHFILHFPISLTLCLSSSAFYSEFENLKNLSSKSR